MIPALHNAEFVRYGVMHRNTFLNSPRLLDHTYCLKKNPRIFFAGQITGVEGYVESTASGMTAGIQLARRLLGQAPLNLPETTAVGALSRYISGGSVAKFQPMNINFGIMPPLGRKIRKKQEKNLALAQRALEDLKEVEL